MHCSGDVSDMFDIFLYNMLIIRGGFTCNTLSSSLYYDFQTKLVIKSRGTDLFPLEDKTGMIYGFT